MNIVFPPVADHEAAPLAGAMLAFDSSFARLPASFYTRRAPMCSPERSLFMVTLIFSAPEDMQEKTS